MWLIPSVIVVAVLALFVALFMAPTPNNPTDPAIGGGAGRVPLTTDSELPQRP